MKDSTKNILVVLMVFVTCICVVIVAPKKGTTKTNEDLHASYIAKCESTKDYVNKKVLVFSDVNNRVDSMQKDFTTVLNSLNDAKIFERLATVDTLALKITELEGSLNRYMESSHAVLSIQDFDINKLRKELDELKKQVEELAKREHSILKTKTYVCPCPCR